MITLSDVSYKIEQDFGVLGNPTGSWSIHLCLVSWNGRKAKFDIRPWNEDMTKCGKGITLSEDELNSLFVLSAEALGYDVEDDQNEE